MLLIKAKRLRQFFGLLETGNFLVLKLALKNPSQLNTFPGKMFRTYVSLAGKDRWRSKSIFELYPNSQGTRIVLEHLSGEGIYTPLDELAYLALLTKLKSPQAIFEIGTFRGRTALNFALNSPPDCTVYTLDLPLDTREEAMNATNPADAGIIAQSITGQDYKGKDVAGKIIQLYGDTSTFDFAPYYGKMDLVFVDGAHHYDAVKKDTQNAVKLAKSGGVILWHDFANYGDYNDVTRAVLDCLPPADIIQLESTQLAMYIKP